MIRKKISANMVAKYNDDLDTLLAKINDNNLGICFIINDSNKLVGVISDGDIRRFILNKSKSHHGNIYAKDIASYDFVSHFIYTPKEVISESLTSKHRVIPLVNREFEIISYVSNELKNFQIGEHTIGSNGDCYIIAEIGNNHQGSLDHAKLLIDAAVDAGANCAKFQMRNLDELYVNAISTSRDLGVEYTIDLLRKYQLSNKDLLLAFDYCLKKGIEPLCTPWDLSSLKILERYGLRAFKLASADLTNFDLIDGMLSTGKPIISSTGMATEQEILQTVRYITEQTDEVVFLHCNSTYPAPYRDINLNFLKTLSEITGANIGYSGHERGIEVPIAAVALGAKVIEKHFTLDRRQEGADHKVSLLPNEFADMCRMIRNVETSIKRSAGPRVLSQGEMLNRHNLGKSVIAARPIVKGVSITGEDVTIGSPGSGLAPKLKSSLIGSISKRDFQPGDLFFDSDLFNHTKPTKKFNFKRLFGVPVRFHDFDQLTKDTELSLVEFHLSYRDMALDENKFLNNVYEYQLVVHCPELFENDHLLDLASDSQLYRDKSVQYVNDTLELTRRLNRFFRNKYKTPFVINVGGWTTDGFVDPAGLARKITNLKDSISKLDLTEVDFSIQTMPPFPWHFGGQSYHNLFVKPQQIVSIVQELGVSICLDTSHTMMAANYYKFDFYKACEDLMRFTSHLHIADASGVDGEGTNLGDGDINFNELVKIINRYPEIGFIPEIWQGHIDFGAKFWSSLHKLENLGLT